MVKNPQRVIVVDVKKEVGSPHPRDQGHGKPFLLTYPRQIDGA